MRVSLVSTVAVLVACSGGGSGGEDPEGSADAESSDTRAGALLPETSSADSSDFLSGAPGDPLSGGGVSPSAAFDVLLAALDERVEERCACELAALGFASLDACVSALREPEFARQCSRSAADEVGEPSLARGYGCLADAVSAEARCLRTAGCSELEECARVSEDARFSCAARANVSPVTDAAVRDLRRECERDDRIGPPGECPSVETSSSEVGQSVFSGITTGQGNDVELSCASESGAADVIHWWAAPSSGSFTFRVQGEGFRPTLGLLDECEGEAGPFDCESSGELRVFVSEGDVLAVVVDGSTPSSSGYYQVHVDADEASP